MSHHFFIFLFHFLCEQGLLVKVPRYNLHKGYSMLLLGLFLWTPMSDYSGWHNLHSVRTQAEAQHCIMTAVILMATAGIISKLVGFSFDERPFCDLMNPEIRLQENYFYVDSDRCLKSPRLSRTNKNQCP